MTGEPSTTVDDTPSSSRGSSMTPTTSAAALNTLSLFDPPKPVLLPEDVTFTTSSAVITNNSTSNKPNTSPPPPPPPAVQDGHRAVHRIRLPALEHNYACVEAAARQQRCAVICVVKADGYGHGAVATALHLADSCGADAFAVATLEEAIQLRTALETNPPGKWSKELASHFHVAVPGAAAANATPSSLLHAGAAATTASSTSQPFSRQHRPARRPSRIRILVLGPPVGAPRCFDEYLHHNVEVMVSGPEVAAALVEWVANDKERKRSSVQRAAKEAMAQALLQPSGPTRRDEYNNNNNDTGTPASPEKKRNSTDDEKTLLELLGDDDDTQPQRKSLRHPSSTLGNVSGQDLAKEIREILMNQKAAQDASNLEKERRRQQKEKQQQQQLHSRGASTVNSSSEDNSVVSSDSNNNNGGMTTGPQQAPTADNTTALVGMEALAKNESSATPAAAGGKDDHDDALTQTTCAATTTTTTSTIASVDRTYPSNSDPQATSTRKRLRWHALVDSGMGRLGFKTDPQQQQQQQQTAGEASAHNSNSSDSSNNSSSSNSRTDDTVAIIQELVDLERHSNAPIEFFGMMTHMADAHAQSTYTNAQVERFTGLLRRVRQAGISVPTVSTDNSMALLTDSLTHFQPDEILSQQHAADSVGFVRVGGAIYGQRPAFPQLKAVSTLMASVRHVAVLKQGESVGYDRAYVATRNVRIATVTIGFADGYPRVLGNGAGQVEIRGHIFPVAGNVCMDMLMVDLGPAEETDSIGSRVTVGDVAVLWGPLDDEEDQGQVRLQDLAGRLETTQSALTCGLDKIRVRRQFL